MVKYTHPYLYKQQLWWAYSRFVILYNQYDLKDFTDQKRDEKMYKKVPIFQCTTPSTGKRLGEVVVGTLDITLV